jgi:hypothetical protein
MTRSADSSADALEAYGRDDPAYGPPGPDWYNNEQAAPNGEQAAGERAGQTAQTAQTRQAEAAQTRQAEAAQAEVAQPETGQAKTAQAPTTSLIDLNPHVVRGPFEPLVEGRGQTSDPDAAGADDGAEGARTRPRGDGRDVGGAARSSADDDREVAPTGMSEYEPISDEFPGLADDDPAGSADAALERLKALHLTASAVAPQSLDAHFDQLLERQRKLISEYLGQTSGPGTLAAASAASGIIITDDDGSLVGLGDDHRSTR